MWLLQKQGTYIERLMDHIQMWYFGSLAVQPEFISHFPIAHRIYGTKTLRSVNSAALVHFLHSAQLQLNEVHKYIILRVFNLIQSTQRFQELASYIKRDRLRSSAASPTNRVPTHSYPPLVTQTSAQFLSWAVVLLRWGKEQFSSSKKLIYQFRGVAVRVYL